MFGIRNRAFVFIELSFGAVNYTNMGLVNIDEVIRKHVLLSLSQRYTHKNTRANDRHPKVKMAKQKIINNFT